MTDSTKGYIAAFTYAFIIGLSFMFIKIALEYSNALDVLAHRFTLSCLCTSIPILIGKIKFDISMKDIVKLIIPLSFLLPVAFFLLQTLSLQLIPSSEAGIIAAMIPIFAIVFAYFILGEKINYKQGFFVLLSVSGVIFISVMKGINIVHFSVLGTLLFLASTMSSALYNVLTRKYVHGYTVYNFTFVMTVVGCVVFNVAAIVQHLYLGTWSIAGYFAPFAEWNFALSIIYLGVPASFMTGFLINYALSKIEAGKMSIFNNLCVVIAIVAGAVFLNEAIYWYHIVGAIVVTTGVFGVNMFGKKDVETEVEFEVEAEEEYQLASCRMYL
ncbi:DMT family transporter [Selenomonadales bacterium OttesenSCG-928-I06]|nr:DMT family transporter [Selenomonadales bacterium OttesenSCG-928-I06]